MDPIKKRFNDELLESKDSEAPKEVRRNSKEDLIQKALLLAQDNNLQIKLSDSKLRRMNKAQLQALLAEILEEVNTKQMAAAVGAPQGANDDVIALATLRMVHNMLATGVEKIGGGFAQNLGYSVDGFAKNLQEPHVQEAVDDCLREIAAENEILQYVKSPYTRLGICWLGAAVTCVKPYREESMYNNKYASPMESRTPHGQDSFQSSNGRSPEEWEVDERGGSPVQNVKKI